MADAERGVVAGAISDRRERGSRKLACRPLCTDVFTAMTFADLKLDLPALCMAHGVKRLEVFGSFARGDAREDSDLDVLVEFEGQERYFDRFMGLKEALERSAGRRVDLLTSTS